MASFVRSLRIQRRVINALIVRELTTRYGRENIGFLWMMAEPLLFAGLVGLLWTFMKGQSEHGVGVVPFVVTGYIPLTLFRNSVGRAVGLFTANASLMYHRMISLFDFIFVRCLIEAAGALMAYLFIGILLYVFGAFPMPENPGFLVAGYVLYSLFTFSVCLILAPLSEISDVLEKFMPVTVYIMIPFSGTFNMTSWLAPSLRGMMYWSPPVNAMEMMRYGVFGDDVQPIFDPAVPLAVTLICMMVGLMLCRHIRRKLVVE